MAGDYGVSQGNPIAIVACEKQAWRFGLQLAHEIFEPAKPNFILRNGLWENKMTPKSRMSLDA